MKLEVYKITNKENGKIYIGITNQGASVRWYKHCSETNAGSTFPIHNAIRKYGKDNFQIEVVEEIIDQDYDYLKEREKHWIAEFDSYNREKGYNLTLGGDGTFGRFHSQETKEKIRQKAVGRKISEETRKKMSESQKKREWNHQELSERAKEANRVRWSKKESREKASRNNGKRKVILQYDTGMNLIREFHSVNEAGRNLGKRHQNIAACARGKLKTAYGFIWKYKE